MGSIPISEEEIGKNCPHCDPASEAFEDLLEETANFRVVSDHHPLCAGHILIIPKEHLSCVGEYSSEILAEFVRQYQIVSAFVLKQFGSVATFEHGKIGQTVFHSHVHILPFDGSPNAIIPEGISHCTHLAELEDLHSIFDAQGRYLFFSIGNRSWTVDTTLGAPRFFRDRFSAAMGRPERGNWKAMHIDTLLMAAGRKENAATVRAWRASIQ
jgi:diadenosine tetraphosphate (Ap4A) HIT family hydrolase